MAAEADIVVRQSDTYKVIHVSGEITYTDYEGLRCTVFEDSADLTNTIQGNTFKASKLQVNRLIECTLVLPPSRLKAWTLTLQRELERYEGTFGPILGPEEIASRIRDPPKKDD